MEQEDASRKRDKQREQMIEFIVKTIQQPDERKLRNIYNFVLHIR